MLHSHTGSRTAHFRRTDWESRVLTVLSYEIPFHVHVILDTLFCGTEGKKMDQIEIDRNAELASFSLPFVSLVFPFVWLIVSLITIPLSCSFFPFPPSSQSRLGKTCFPMISLCWKRHHSVNDTELRDLVSSRDIIWL